MRGRRLYKYFSEQKWTDAFLNTGSMRFRSLAHFRDYEDAQVRGDRNESIAILRPSGGLAGRNHTQGRDFLIPNAAVEFCAKAGEIFVYASANRRATRSARNLTRSRASKSSTQRCFAGAFKKRCRGKHHLAEDPVTKDSAITFGTYKVTDNANPRWACPDLIALSKLDAYTWQDEFRLAFSLTDALRFENISGRIVQGNVTRTANPAEHCVYDVNIGSLRDIAVVHQFKHPCPAPS